MTSSSRILSVITGLCMIAVGIGLFLYPSEGLAVAARIFSLTCTLRGFQILYYYLTMARHMVGGRRVLYRGIIYLDVGIFASVLADSAQIYIVLYLAVIHVFNGFVDIMRAREAYGVGSPGWKGTALNGVTNVIIATVVIAGGFVLHSVRLVMYIYAAGLIYSAVIRIATALRKSAIVYIQ